LTDPGFLIPDKKLKVLVQSCSCKKIISKFGDCILITAYLFPPSLKTSADKLGGLPWLAKARQAGYHRKARSRFAGVATPLCLGIEFREVFYNFGHRAIFYGQKLFFLPLYKK